MVSAIGMDLLPLDANIFRDTLFSDEMFLQNACIPMQNLQFLIASV